MRGAYLVSTSLVGDIFDIAVDVIHRVGLGGDVVFGGLGDGMVLDFVCHCGWLFVCLVQYCVMLGIRI